MRTDEARPVRLEDYRPPDWLVETVELDITLHPEKTRVRSILSLKPNPFGAAPAPLVLNGDGLKLLGLRLDGDDLSGEHVAATPDSLTVAQPPNRPFRLEIETEVSPASNTQLMGLYRSGGTYCTQCEAEGFRRITYFPDRPDVLAVYTTRIEAEKAEAPVLLGNGNLTSAGDLPGTTRHFAVWHDPFPKPCYLFALVGGNLACVEDHFITRSGRRVTLRIYVEHGKQPICGYAMDSLKRSMLWDEQTFGREYDLDIFMIVAVSDFNMGAMENKGLNIFNDKYVLASPETATDSDYERIEAIIAHEYFHNWTGNRITCRDWFQLCLKEGLTVFRDQEFTSDQRSRPVKRIADVRMLRSQQFVEDAGPLAHPVRPTAYHEINNFYTATVYEKGAEIVRMLKVLLGPETFRSGLDLYFARHDGEAATVEQFIQCFADASGRNLAQILLWYDQAGTPQVAATGAWDPKGQSYRLDLTQAIPPTPGQPTKEPVIIPFRVGLVAPEGGDFPLRLTNGRALERDVLVLSAHSESFTFGGITARPIPSLNREFSAPIKLETDLSGDDLRFLAAHDSDPFNRWQALQTLAVALLADNVGALRAGRATRADDGLTNALRAILEDRALEPAFVAQAITLPTEADIAREIGRDVDPDAIFAARRELRTIVAHALRNQLGAMYEAMTEHVPYSPDAASAGRRALKNACVDLLATVDGVARAAEQYGAADNMTDRMAALSTIALYDVPQRTAAIEDFYRRFEHDPLVIDKWFALQAMIPESKTLDRVQALAQHPAYSHENPNRIRALVGSFAQANQTQFNRLDGRGYEFVATCVLDLDRRNPQVAARLMGAFKSWRALEAARRHQAEQALRRVAAEKALSRDVADITRRALGEDATA